MALEPATRGVASAPAVALYEGQPITTSQDVAAYFGKRHRDVLRDIRKLISLLGPDHERNFALMIAEVEIGKGGKRAEPYYRMSRDGFTLLAMGFTGQRALEFKLAYIDAFNRMEAQLRQTEPEREAIQRFHATFDRGRFLASMGGDGAITLKPVPDAAAVFDPQDERRMIELMAQIVPASLLPAMIGAAVERLRNLAERRRPV